MPKFVNLIVGGAEKMNEANTPGTMPRSKLSGWPGGDSTSISTSAEGPVKDMLCTAAGWNTRADMR